MDNKFNFQLMNTKYLKSKDGKDFAILSIYCSYDFLFDLITSKEKAIKLQEITEKNHNKDITNFISVYWDKKAKCFSYSLEIN